MDLQDIKESDRYAPQIRVGVAARESDDLFSEFEEEELESLGPPVFLSSLYHRPVMLLTPCDI